MNKNIGWNNFFSHAAMIRVKKPISGMLMVSMLAMNVPFISVTKDAQAAVIDPNKWVNVNVQPDPILTNLTIPNEASTKGMWSSVYNWPLVAVHATILPDGKVLSFGTDRLGTLDGRTFDVWDPRLGLNDNSHTTTTLNSAQDSFCSSATFLADGKLLISGGNSVPGGIGVLGVNSTSNIYSTTDNSITKANSNLALDRWYATMITLPNGNPIMLGGMQAWKEEMAYKPDVAIAQGWPSMTPETYINGQWHTLLGAYSREAFGPDYNRTSYPRAWVAPNGLVFGISADKMWYLDPTGNGNVTDAGTFKGPYSGSNPVNVGSTNTAVMYDIGKILVAGGNGSTWSDGLPASNQSTVVDINRGLPVLTEQGTMTHARRLANAIVLATGEVVMLAGTKIGNNSGIDAVYAAEIWNPTTGRWSLGADASIFRGYHGQATLLTNGTILSYGGGFPIADPGLKAQIYYPPYLFKANTNGTSSLATRPAIQSISGLTYDHLDPIQMNMQNANPISSVVLIGVSNGTHAFNSGQRRIPLRFTQENERLSANIPNANLTPPGYYQVVTVAANGVPSIGTIINIGLGANAPIGPTPVVIPFNENEQVSMPVISAGGNAAFTVSAATNYTYSWNFGDGSADTPFNADPSVTKTYNQPGIYVVTLSSKFINGLVNRRTFIQIVATSKTPRNPTSSSPITYETRTGNYSRVWVVNPDNDSVSVINASTNTLIRTIPVGQSPKNVAVAPNGNIWVTNKSSANISVISPTSLAVIQTISLKHGSQPHGLAFSPNQNVAFIALEASGTLIKVDSNNGAQLGSVELGQHIRHVSVNQDTSMVLVSRFITPPLSGESTANIDTATQGGEVIAVIPSTMTNQKKMVLRHSDKPDTATQGSGVPNYLSAAVISPDGTTAWVPSKQDNIKRGLLRNGLPLNFQNTVRAISSRINLSTLAEDYAKRVDHDNSSVGSAAVYHPSGTLFFVALETSRQVAVVDALNGYELFKFDVGRAPQGLAISPNGQTLYVHEFMDRSVSVIDLSPLIFNGQLKVNASNLVYTVPIQQDKLSANVLLGKQLFYDAKDVRLSRDSYMSCASCHHDGEHDGRVWDLTGFGEGLRNTIQLKGRAGMGHGFLHWSANFDEVQDFEKQIRDLAGGIGLMTNDQFNTGTRNQPLGDKKAGVSQDLDNLASYVGSFSLFEDSPHAVAKNTLSALALTGKKAFANNNCISCHAYPAFTNSMNASTLANVGTIKPSSGKRLNGNLTSIDVPTLRDVWNTGPYLHDGSAQTIAEAISAHSTVKNGDLNAIVQYVLEISEDISPPLAPDQIPPQVSITTPIANTTYGLGQAITITVTASDADGSVKRVEFYDGNNLIGAVSALPYVFTYSNPSVGDHQLTAKAIDNQDASNISQAVNVTVLSQNKSLSILSGVLNLTKKVNTIASNNGLVIGAKTTPVRKSSTKKLPDNMVECAEENKLCILPNHATKVVWFGSGNDWYTKTVTGEIECTMIAFKVENPENTFNRCYYQ